MLPTVARAPVAVSSSSGNVAATAAVATLPAVSDRTTYISGFQVNALGATAGLFTLITIAGLAGGTVSIPFYFPTGATVQAVPLNVSFPVPLAASGPNVSIVVTVPSGGAGNTNSAVSAQGFQL